METLYTYENAREVICGECHAIYPCEACPVEIEYRALLDEEFGKDFPTPITAHAIDSYEFYHDTEKWLARRHRKNDIKAKKAKVKVRKRDTGFLSDNYSTVRRKDKMFCE